MNQPKYQYQSEFARRYVEQGRQEGQRAVVLRQLERRFGPLSATVVQRIERADDATLAVWAERLLDADTLDDALAD